MNDSNRGAETRRQYDLARPAFAALDILVGGFFLLGLLLTFVNVVARYGLSVSISWAEEVTIFLMIGFVFIGMVRVSWEGAQLRMDIVLGLLPPRFKRWVNLFAIVVELVVGAFVVYASFQVASVLGQLGRHSVAAHIPMVIPHSAVLIGFGLLLIAVLWRVRALMRMPIQSATDETPGRSTAESTATDPDRGEKR